MTDQTAPTLDVRAEVLRALTAGDDIDVAHEKIAIARVTNKSAQPYLEELLDLATEIFILTGAGRDDPIAMEGLADTYLSEYEFRGKVDYRNLHYALTYPALRAGGLHPDLWDDISYWQSDVWPYALHAVVAYLRIAEERTGMPVPDVAARLEPRGHASVK
jgi:hypothetical protein